jgi:hypothetical protein
MLLVTLPTYALVTLWIDSVQRKLKDLRRFAPEIFVEANSPQFIQVSTGSSHIFQELGPYLPISSNNITMERSTIFNGKINYVYGNFK